MQNQSMPVLLLPAGVTGTHPILSSLCKSNQLIHDANSVSETQNGNTFGSVEGGETDAMATFGISN